MSLFILSPHIFRYLHVLPRKSEGNVSTVHSVFYLCAYSRINKKKEGNENEKEKERMDTEQVVGTIILSMHGITDRNEILGRLHSEYMIEMCISILIERLLASIFDRENPPTILNASSNRCISISTLARLIFRRYTDFSLKRMIFHDQLTGSFTYHSIITTNPLLHER